GGGVPGAGGPPRNPPPQSGDADPGGPCLVAGAFAGHAAHSGNVEGCPPRGESRRGGTGFGPGRARRDRQDCARGEDLTGEDLTGEAPAGEEDDALDEALMET